MFTGRNFNSGKIDLRAIREHLSSTRVLKMLLIGGNLQEQVEQLRSAFANDSNTDPPNLWFPSHPERHFIQLGEYAKRKDRPDFVRFHKTSYESWSDYLVVFGFAMVYEQETTDGKLKALESQKIELRVNTIPNAGNRRYIGYLEPVWEKQTELYKIKPGDVLKITFN
ncbi:hypothetical protein BJY04DRAFT_222720 [Aspergillus karnatakaensis]|uniref:uncharacterized protein n=1 Tax=Aspergillus karnatakaensis TaxID=1810916 RepID=UPI003CCD3BAE